MDGKKVECEVGDVHHVLYYGSAHLHHAIRTRVVERGAGRDGRVFPYVAHYLATGEMLYPVHEGEAMVTRLLQELTRLDLVQDFLRTPAASSSASRSAQKEGGEGRLGGDMLKVNTLKVNTRRHPLSFSAILTHLRPAHAHAHTPAVYRPPSNKRQGSTLVVVGRSALRLREVVVHGPRGELGRIFPNDHLLPAHAPAHAALDAQVTPTPPSDSSLSPAHAALSILSDKGYTPTVRSSWVCGQSGALITQWLVYRRRGGRRKGGGSGGGVKAENHKSSSSFVSYSKLTGTLSAASTSSLFSSSFPTLRRASSTTDLASVSTTSSSSFSSSSSSSSSSFSSSSRTMRSKLKTRSKSILTLHDPPPRPSLTLKRLLSVFF
ncbi:uncharacterized protein LOC123514070 [Portunus trituberculatus]|uniref:uncharacterized protein LOC123514070 n=1 Tax=Portunus trituberculatus TaxID=210409 RepID=UPI001E1D18E8|nr:uncharacterized protein LOC123514070 [Portunus trituberculatus]